MSHERSITVERDGKHFIESSVEPGKVLEGPFNTGEAALQRSIERSNEFRPSDNLGPAVQKANDNLELERLKTEAQEFVNINRPTDARETEQPDPEDPLGVRVLKDVGRGTFEVPTAIFGGGMAAGKEFFQALDSMGDWLNNNIVDLRVNVPSISPEIDTLIKPFLDPATGAAGGFQALEPADPITVTGSLTKGIAQFVTGFIPLLRTAKAFQGVPKSPLGKFGQVEVTSGITEALVFDPHEDRLSNLLEEAAPEFSNAVTRFLQAEPDDTEAEGRLKNALEGFGLGALGTGFVQGVKAIKANRISQGTNPQKPIGAPDKPVSSLLGDPAAKTSVISRDPASPISMKAAKEAAGSFLRGEIPTSTLPFKINWARINSDQELTKTVEDVSQLFKGQIDKARRKTITDETLNELAERVGMTSEDFLRMQPGGTLNAEQILAFKFTIESSADFLQELARVARDTTDNSIIFDFVRMVKIHGGLQAKFQGAASEAGRALRALQLPTGSKAKQLEDIAGMLTAQGGSEQVRRLARAIAESNDPAAIDRAVRGSAGKRIADMLVEVWYFDLLSGPQTHAVNVTSSALKTAYRIPERFLAAGIAKLRGTQSVEVGEAEQMFYGMIEALPQAFMASFRAFKDDIPSDEFGKIETRNQRAITAKNFGVNAQDGSVGKVVGKSLDALGTIARLPTRALMAEDEFFRFVSGNMQVNALSFRQAVNEGLEGDALANRIDELRRNPPPEFLEDAVTFARQNTWTTPLGSLGQSVQRAANHAGWNIPAKMALPFIRTPSNLVKDAVNFTPLGLLGNKMRREIRAGSAQGDQHLAQIAIGGMLALTFADQVWKGNVTGMGPTDPDLNSTWRRVKTPYSIRAGDTWYSYNRLDPFGLFLGAVASYAEIAGSLAPKDRDEIAGALALATSRSVFSKTWMQGPSEMLEAFNNPDRHMADWIRQQGATFLVPTGAAQITRQIDPVWREVYDLIDAIKARTPGLSHSLPARRNLWGEAIWMEGGLGPDIVSPIYKFGEKNRPIDNWFIANQVKLSLPSRIRSGVELSPWQYDSYVQLSGNEVKDPSTNMGAYDTLNALVNGSHPMSDVWAAQTDGPEGGKALIAKEIINNFRDAAWAQLLKEDTVLASRVQARAAERARALEETNMNPERGRLQ